MLKLLHNCTHLTREQSNAQNSPNQASAIREPWTSSWILENAEEPEIKLPTSVGSLKRQEGSRKTSTSALLITPKPLIVYHNKSWKILQEMGIPNHLTCLLRNLYAGQEATVRTWHRATDWSQIGRGLCQGWYVSLLIWLICWVHHEKRWAGRSTSWNQDCQEKYQ